MSSGVSNTDSPEPPPPVRLLLVEGGNVLFQVIRPALGNARFDYVLECVQAEPELLHYLSESPPNLVLSHSRKTGLAGRRVLSLVREKLPGIPLIFLSEGNEADEVAELLREGAADFIVMERLGRLVRVINRALRSAQESAERRLAEISLRDSETRFRAIFEGTRAGIAIEDLHGHIVMSNQALQMMLGYSGEELQQLSRSHFIHALDNQEHTAIFRKLLAGQRDHIRAEKRFVRKDGRIFWGRLTMFLVRDPSGRPQFPITMIDDETERQRAKEALMQYAAIIESSSDAIVSQTFDGIILSWNSGAERLYGYPASEANGRPISIIVPPEKQEELEAILERTRMGDRCEDIETIRTRKDGSLIHISTSTAAIKDISGQLLGVSSISRDISERKRAEDALRESEENYRQLVELSPDAIFIQSEDRYVYVNGAGLKLFGVGSPEQLIGKTNYEIVPSDFHDLVRQHMPPLGADHATPMREEKFVRIDGSLVDVEATAIPFLYRGNAAFQRVVRDITQRKLAEDALRRNEASLARAQRIAHLGSWEMDLQTGSLIWSEETHRIFGLKPASFEGTFKDFLRRVHPEDRELVIFTGEALRRGESTSIDHRIIVPSGEERVVNEQAEPVRDARGKLVRLLGTVLDVTQRKRAEAQIAALSNLGERLSSARAAKDAALIITDVADQLLGWDACTLDLCFDNPEHFNSILSIDIIDGVRRECPPACVGSPPSPLVRRICQGGAELILRSGPQTVSDTVFFGDKSRASMSLMYVPVRHDQRTVGVLSIQSYTPNAYSTEDLKTLQALADHCDGALERIRAEAQSQKLAAFPQFNPNPVFELAADGSLNYHNQAALQMAQFLGRPHPMEILPPTTREIVQECLRTGQNGPRHSTTIRERTISWSFFPVPAIGVVHCYAVDVTERQNLEAQLRQSQKMETVGQLAGGIAHDFNNILTVIQGHTSMLSGIPGLASSALESAQEIAMAAERAANLTRQLLTFSRRQIIQPKNLDLNEVVHHMTMMLRRLLGEDITLQVSYASNLPPIQADPGMMEQIILNLAINGRDAMANGGKLLITTALVEVGEDCVQRTPEARLGRHVRLKVQDSGSGITPENLTRIFEPFFTTKDVGKGTGLGLATVYGIVRQHSGWIEVSSVPGEQTSFEVFLPATAGRAEPVHVRTAETKVRGGSETVLVVEDEPSLRFLVRSVLERNGYNVLDAESGLGAVGVWLENREQIQLLLTDMVMPHGISGRELAERFQREKPELKVIFSSGYSLEVVGADMVLQEGLNFLQKPYHPRKLAQAVRDCLDGKGW